MPDEPNAASSAVAEEPSEPAVVTRDAPVVVDPEKLEPARAVDPLRDGTPQELKVWRETGKTPQEQRAKKPEPPAGKKPPEKAAPAASPEKGKTETAEESGSSQPRESSKRKGAEERKAELGAEIQQKLKERRELVGDVEFLKGLNGKSIKQYVDEQVAEAMKKGVKPAAEPPPAATEEQPAEEKLERPRRPKIDQFETEEDFEKAQEAYEDALVQYNFKIREQQEAERAEQQRVEDEQKALKEGWTKQLDEAITEYGKEEFEAVALNKDMPVSDVMFAAITSMPMGTHVLFYLGEHLDKAAEIAKMPPFEATRALNRIEFQIEQERSAAGQGERREPEQRRPERREPEVTRTPKPPTPKSPPPAREVGARSDSQDEADAAAARGDVAEYNRIMNARERRAAR